MARLPLFLRRRPSPEALAWVERSLGARVTSLRRLRGGMSASVHLLRVATPAGATRDVVLRRFTRRDWFEREPDLAEREARVLTALAGRGVPAPELLAVDATGAECDVAAVLITRVPGRMDLAPPDVRAYVRALAEPLPALHALGSIEGIPSYYPYFAEEGYETEPPAWATRPVVWRAALQLVAQPWPAVTPTFVHRDYHPGNVLWRRGRLTGITDWVNASNGPAGVDAGHCRVNVAQLFGVEAAEEFRLAYEAMTGEEHHPFWDLLHALDVSRPDTQQWHDAGRTDLTERVLLERHEDYVEMLVRRLC